MNLLVWCVLAMFLCSSSKEMVVDKTGRPARFVLSLFRLKLTLACLDVLQYFYILYDLAKKRHNVKSYQYLRNIYSFNKFVHLSLYKFCSVSVVNCT